MMEYTLADFWDNRPIPELTRITSQDDFSVVPVESISFQEFPLDDYIKKNELVLSTGRGCMENPSLFRELIRLAHEAGAAAIVFSILDDEYVFPPDIAAYAEQMCLPIFRAPWKYRLSDVNSFVAKQIQNKKQQIFRQVQSELFNLFFESAPLSAATALIETRLSIPAAVTDERLHCVGRSPSAPVPPAEGQPQQIEIQINGALSGYLLLYGKIGDREALGRFVLSPLSLWFYRKNIEDLAAIKVKNSFVWDLAEHNYSLFEEMRRQGRQLRFDLDRPYTCVLLQAEGRNAYGPMEDYSPDVLRAAAAMEALVLGTAKDLGLRIMFAERKLQFVLFVENLEPAPEALLTRFLDVLDRQLSAALPKEQFFWGLSETVMERRAFDRLYANAALALQYCRTSRTGVRRFTYRDTREAQIVSVLGESMDIRSHAQETLAPLLSDGHSERIDLIGTLTEFISCSYNTSLTARRLHLHRQSLLYRLEKIEVLTGLSLSSHRDLFLLEVYLRIFSDV